MSAISTSETISTLHTLLSSAYRSLISSMTRLDADGRRQVAKAPEAFFKHGPTLMSRIELEADDTDRSYIDTAAVQADLELVEAIDQSVDLLEALRRALLDLRLQVVDRSWRATLTWRAMAELRARSSAAHAALLTEAQVLFARRPSSRAEAAR